MKLFPIDAYDYAAIGYVKNGSSYRALRDYRPEANTYLELLKQTALDISGYYPLYRTEAVANAVGDGTSHSHMFDGVTYYMPNGVTYYHGNYGTNSY